jgi:hypothetical protein
MSQLDKSIITAKDGRYHAEDPKETLDSFAFNDGGEAYPTILPSFYRSSVFIYLYISYIRLNRIELITAVHFIRKLLSSISILDDIYNRARGYEVLPIQPLVSARSSY